jgi:GTP pyrophosphokinase
MMNHAVMTEIDIEKRIRQLLKNTKNYFVSVIKRCLKKTKLIRKAFDVSVEAHKEQRRKSGRLIFSIHCCGKNSRFREIGLGVPTPHYYMMLWKTPTTVKDIERILIQK